MTRTRTLLRTLALAATATLAALALAPRALADSSPSWQRAPEDTFQLTELIIAGGVEDRRPVEVADSFKADGRRVYAYLNVFNKGARKPLTVIWKQGEKTYHKATVVVGRSPSWRTWAFLDARRSLRGDWTVLVLDQSGRELARHGFTLE